MIDIGLASKRDRPAGFAGTSCAPNAMDVIFRVLGDIVIDDDVDILYMDASGRLGERVKELDAKDPWPRSRRKELKELKTRRDTSHKRKRR